MKTPTVQELLKIGVHSNLLRGVHADTLIRIKVEIDTDPTLGFAYEQKFLSQPVPVSIRCVNEECLFAGKMHAALFRAWKGRVKGRDWYDMLWFIRRKIPLNLPLFSKLNGREEVLNNTRAQSCLFRGRSSADWPLMLIIPNTCPCLFFDRYNVGTG